MAKKQPDFAALTPEERLHILTAVSEEITARNQLAGNDLSASAKYENLYLHQKDALDGLIAAAERANHAVAIQPVAPGVA